MVHPRFVIFIRYPSPGKAKSRLIPALGTHGAALAQHRMTQHTLRVANEAADARNAQIELHISGDGDATVALYPGPWRFVAQCDGDLGSRLIAAMHGAFQRGGGPVIILGSDCPQLAAHHLISAIDQLRDSDMVLGQAVDGGYYLIGLNRPIETVFEGIDWSTDRVASQTRSAAQRAGLSLRELPTLADVDEPQDLPNLTPPYSPRHIAITGATGSLGTQFLRYLLLQLPNLCVTALVRPAPRALRSAGFDQLLQQHGHRIRLIEQDLLNLGLNSTQRRAMVESDGLWHFAGSTHLQESNGDQSSWQTNDTGTAALLELLQHSDNPSPLFHLSTAYVCGNKTGVVTEDDLSSRTFRNGYEGSKFAAEQRVREAFGTGMNGCIFRPSVVVSETTGAGKSLKIIDRVMAAMFAAANGRDLLVLRLPESASLNCVHGDWVMAALATLAGQGDRSGKTYHLTARHPLHLGRVARIARSIDPAWRIEFDPTAKPRDLPLVSRQLDRALSPMLPNFTASVSFDRSRFDADAPELAEICELDAEAVLRWHLAHSSIGHPDPKTKFVEQG